MEVRSINIWKEEEQSRFTEQRIEGKQKIFLIYVCDELKTMPIENLFISARALNSLKRNRIETIGQLLDVVTTIEALTKLKSLGVVTAYEIVEGLRELSEIIRCDVIEKQ